jgi:hypothetical protein
MLDSLTTGRIEVTSTGTATSGTPLPARTAAFTPKVSHPFGKQCGAFIAAGVVLDANGLRQAP